MGGVRCVGASALTGASVSRLCIMATVQKTCERETERLRESEIVRGNEWPRLMPRVPLIGGV